jgi:hypothetical protein
MRSFRKLPSTAFKAAIVAAILGAGASSLHWRALAGEPLETRKAAEAAKAKEAAAAEDASAAEKAAKSAADKDNERMHDIPVSKEHPAKGLKIPYFDNDGKLQMIFVIGVATRMDADHIDMSNMQVETFDEAGKHEMGIDLPTSVLDLNTSVISTQKHVTIRREDFILTGETMEFNTKTKQGNLGGSVKMLIYNLDNGPTTSPASETPTPQPAAPATPPPASESKSP